MPTSASSERSHCESGARVGGGLIALNCLLLAALALVTLGPGAGAQNQPSQRRLMGEYTMVGGAAQGVTGNVVYILDSSNMQLIALRWDQTRRSVAGVGYRDLRADREASAGQR
jgi:hypothetical protein